VSVTVGLVSIVVMLGLALAWRLLRWRWRPRLRIASALRPDGAGHVLVVRNAGAAAARRCRGRLLRADREEDGGWRRVEPDPEELPLTWTGGARERDLGPGEEDALVVARGIGSSPAGTASRSP
jgi:Kef-type K+ transport system membrane component KefB